MDDGCHSWNSSLRKVATGLFGEEQMNARQWCLLAACLFAIPSASAIAPQRAFVASYGLDSNPCSLTAPCRGFQAAIDIVAAKGEVVVLDSAGYGAMDIRKSVSVIVPSGIHAGLSPSTGIPLPGYPGQYGVVFIDIQDTDVVVLRGLNINQQGTVTGGIEWISAHGGTVQIENTVINGFPKEGIYLQAPAAKLVINDSQIRNNGVGVYGFQSASGVVAEEDHGIYADRVQIEGSTICGIIVASGVWARFVNSVITSNHNGISIQATTNDARLFLDRTHVSYNTLMEFTLSGVSGNLATLEAAASTIHVGGYDLSGATLLYSLGNNSGGVPFDTIVAPH